MAVEYKKLVLKANEEKRIKVNLKISLASKFI
jgi:hypothetical protein